MPENDRFELTPAEVYALEQARAALSHVEAIYAEPIRVYNEAKSALNDILVKVLEAHGKPAEMASRAWVAEVTKDRVELVTKA